jgi:hypothetical protein
MTDFINENWVTCELICNIRPNLVAFLIHAMAFQYTVVIYNTAAGESTQNDEYIPRSEKGWEPLA